MTTELKRVYHFRYVDINNVGVARKINGQKMFKPDNVLQNKHVGEQAESRGGVTVAAMGIGDTIHWGVAKCHINDGFNRKRGYTSALGRAKSKKAVITEMMDIADIKDKAFELATDMNIMSHFE